MLHPLAFSRAPGGHRICVRPKSIEHEELRRKIANVEGRIKSMETVQAQEETQLAQEQQYWMNAVAGGGSELSGLAFGLGGGVMSAGPS